MRLRWTEEATSDLTRIADYLFDYAPERADHLVRTLYEAPSSLLAFPGKGRRTLDQRSAAAARATRDDP